MNKDKIYKQQAEVNDFRQACKKYGDKKISEKDWQTIKDAIYWSPTSHGWEPYRVLTINKENKELRNELFEPMLTQGIVENADKLLIFISLKAEVYNSFTPWVKSRVLRKAKEVEGNFDEISKDVENSLHFKAHQTMMDIDNTNAWSEKQAYIGMSFAMYSAALLGIDSTPMEGMDRNKVRQVLEKHNLIEDNENVAVCLSLGYRFDNTSFAHWGSGKRLRVKPEEKFKEV